MAGRHDIADSSVGLAPREKVAGQQSQASSDEAWQKNSIWQLAATGSAFQKPFEAPSDQPMKTEPIQWAPGDKRELTPQTTTDYRKIFRQPGMSDRILDAIPGREEARQKAEQERIKAEEERARAEADAQSKAALTPEQREQYVAKLREHMTEQRYWTNMELGAIGLSTYSLFRPTPAGFAVSALGLAGYVYTFIRARQENSAARELMTQMPKDDRERFGYYQQSVEGARKNISDGYLVGGSVGLTSMLKVTPYVNEKLAAATFIGSIGNHVYQSNYRMPNFISKFDAEVEAWRKQLKAGG